MTRKTFLLILRIAAVLIIVAVFAPKIINFLSKTEEEENVIGYSTGTELAEVTNLVEQGEISLGDVVQPYQILEVTVLKGPYSGQTFEIEHGTRQIRKDMILLKEGEKSLSRFRHYQMVRHQHISQISIGKIRF